LLSVVTQALCFLYQCCVHVSLSLLAMPLAAISGKSRFWVLESVLEHVFGIECRRRFSPLGQGDYSYDIELYASAKMFAFA
jgi:hypothetical protein